MRSLAVRESKEFGGGLGKACMKSEQIEKAIASEQGITAIQFQC
jgi:hypothetical protein